MHWWQGAFSSSSKRHSDDDSVIVAESRYSVKGGFFSGRRIRNHGRSRKVRYVSAKDVDPWRSLSRSELSASARSSAAVTPSKPQPLPMPELHVLLRNDPKFASPSLPLPSSRGSNQNQRGAYDDRERDRERQTAETSGDDDLDRHNGLRRISRLVNPQTNVEQPETQPCRCKSSGQKQTPKARSPYGYRISIPISAPTSPYSSPALSPLGCDMIASHYMTPPSVFHVWSAPEIPYSAHTCFYNQTPFEKVSSSVDSSPLHSPTVGPASPLPGLLSPESRREGGGCGVHPLPRPPGTAASQPSPKESLSPAASTRLDFSGAAELDFLGSNIPPQLLPIAQVAGKPKVMPIKSRWRKGKLIGRGTYGSVYVASNRETGALCAMKEVEILPDDSNSAERMRQLEQEIKVLSHLKHPNIVQYFGSEIVRDKFYIYLEYVHPGSINKFIQDHCGAITEPIVRNFTRHILCGLAYLHSTKTIHRDIKGANLLVDAYGVVKLADFGMAKHLNGEAANLSLKGSPYWLAPELLQSVVSKDASTDVALAVEIWSLGCTIIEMMDGKPPWSEYEGAAALFKVLQEIPPIPETLSADGKDFLQCCFRRNPAERPTATKLLDHPFVNYSSSHHPNAYS